MANILNVNPDWLIGMPGASKLSASPEEIEIRQEIFEMTKLFSRARESGDWEKMKAISDVMKISESRIKALKDSKAEAKI